MAAAKRLGELGPAGAYAVGQQVSFEGVSGEIVAIDSVTCTLRDGDGATQRVPNSLLLESVVTVRDEPAGSPESGS